jgi:hypothetical protein
MYLALGRAEPAPRVTTETPGPVSALALERVLDPKTREFGAVCRIYTQVKGGHSIGSGVLITPRHVLTCAHVIEPPQNPTNVMAITVFVAQNGPADGKHGVKADGWAVKHGWSPHCCRSWDEDYGIIRLSKPVTTEPWPVTPFDPGRIAGKTAYLAGYPVQDGDPDAHFMFRSRGAIAGTLLVTSCLGTQLTRRIWPRIDDTTRLVAHDLGSARSMSGGPLWSFVDGKRLFWGLHAGDVDAGRKKGVLLNGQVRTQIARWVMRDLPAR